MATTTFTTMIPTPQPKKAGPPVPPRPQQSSLLKTAQQRDASSSSSSSAAAATSQSLVSKVGLEQPQILNKRLIPATAGNTNTTSETSSTTSVATSGGRTVIYKSPSLNLQKRQDEREKRSEASTQTATSAINRTTSAASAATRTATATATATTAKAKQTNGTQAPKPPLKLRKAPDVPTNFKPRITTLQPEVKEHETKSNGNGNGNGNDNNNSNSNSNANNIVIVQSSQGAVTLNRHHSMGSASPQNKPSALAKDTRLSLGKVDFERVGKIQVQQLQPTSQPLPKARKIVKVPIATLDVDDNTSSITTSSSSSNTLHVNLFKRSKTSIENFTSRSNNTTVSTNSTGSFLSGKTVEIKNNLKNAAERLFSEIMVNQQKQNACDSTIATNTIITKHERAIQHQAADSMKLNNANSANNIKVVSNNNNPDSNCTRINITSNTANPANHPNNGRQAVSAFNSPEKKSAAFHEMLISELAAMRTRSCSMENLQTTKQSLHSQSPQTLKESAIDKQFQNYKQFKTLETQLKTVNNNKQQQQQQTDQQQHQHHHHHQQHSSPHNKHHDDDIDADNIEDADGDIEEDLKKSLKVITAQNTPRKRTPSGCSSDSSPYGTERSARIRTSDWIEVGDNGKQVTLTSCHISLEDSGLEDEERMDEMSSSGVGDSWDSVKEAEQQKQMQQQHQQQQYQQQTKRTRNVKRIMSINDLPPLPKSLSGINKMLASDSGLVSDVDTEIKNTKNNELNQYDNQKENNNNLNINNKNSNNNNNALKDASDKFNNASVTAATTATTTTATTTASTSATTPLKEINGNETISEIPPAIPGSKLDTQIATLRKEMFGLRQLDLSLLSQLWALNDSIQEFRSMIQDQDQEDDETYSAHSRSPSPYDSVSSDGEDEILNLKAKNRMELSNGNVITTQPKLTKSYAVADNEMKFSTSAPASTSSPSMSASSAPSTTSTLVDQHQRSQLLKPPLPKPLDVKPVPRMRSAPPPPPTHRKSQSAPPRPT